MRFSRVSIALLVLQLLIVSTVAGKYIYQRVTCPRVWTRAAAYDPSLVMRGRYLSLQLIVTAIGAQAQRRVAAGVSASLRKTGSRFIAHHRRTLPQ